MGAIEAGGRGGADVGGARGPGAGVLGWLLFDAAAAAAALVGVKLWVVPLAADPAFPGAPGDGAAAAAAFADAVSLLGLMALAAVLGAAALPEGRRALAARPNALAAGLLLLLAASVGAAVAVVFGVNGRLLASLAAVG